MPTENEAQNKPQPKRWILPLSVVVILSFLMVVAILVWLQVTPHIESRPDPVRAAKANFRTFVTALKMFKDDIGFYPIGTNGLNDLVVKPTSASADWHRYMDHVPLDPWGHPYLYVSPGNHNTNSYDLSSAGPDGKPGTSDDIVNW